MKNHMMKLLAITGLILGIAGTAGAVSAPNPSVTPGVLCTPQDPNFQGYDYPEHIARCNRNVGDAEKTQIAAEYGGIPQSSWGNYEFDHFIPLCAGGSDDIRNLWPQPIKEAKLKDVVELDVCNAMSAGTMTQTQAIQKIHDFFTNGANFFQQSELSDLTIQRFLQVTPNIYRGGRPSPSDVTNLQAQYKVHTIIDLEDDTKVDDAENQTARGMGIQFLSTPLNPYGTPTDAEINGVLAQMQNPANFPIFIHCHYGEDRTGLVIGLYRVLVQGWPAAQAYQEMITNGFHPTLTGLLNYFKAKTGFTGP